MMSPRLSEVLATDSPASFDAAVRRAAELLRAGQPVAVPTETVYGLAANALDADAVTRLFQIKGRPQHNPVIVHVASQASVLECAACWPAVANKLARAFWPGPLTLVVPRASVIPDAVTAGGPTVGLRWPSHPFIQALIRTCGFPLAAPSANRSGQLSPTTAAHVLEALGDRIPLIVDGGPSNVGIESTVVDVAVETPRILRPGIIQEEALAAVAGKMARPGSAGDGPLKSPGLLPKHYSPRAKLVIMTWKDEAELRTKCNSFAARLDRVFILAHTRIPGPSGFGGVSVVPHDAVAYARALYAELHRCDAAGAQLIVVESVPETPEWRALADRLSRAAT